MEILVFILIIIGFAVVMNIGIWIAEFIQNAKLSLRFSKDVNNLSDRLEKLKISDLAIELRSFKKNEVPSMGYLVDSEGKIINVCPKCGSTMQAQSPYYGVRLSCCKRGCYYSENINISDNTFEKLTVR